MYYWDGVQWVSSLSPDGRYRWDGAAWVPTQWAPPTTYYAPRQPVRREATSWTRPLQYLVIGYYTLSALVTATLPFWMGGMMTQIMRTAMERQQQQDPNLQPPPQSFYDAMNSIMTGSLWVGVVFGLAIVVVVIIGALQRWTWLYYALVVLYGLSVVSGPANMVNIATGNFASTYGFALPGWVLPLGIVSWGLSAAFFAVLLIALIKRGPWGMVKVSPGGSPAT